MDTREIWYRLRRRMMIAAAIACLLGALIVAWNLVELFTRGPMLDPWQDVPTGQVEPPTAP